MPFLQAVFCLKGFDNRSRFLFTSIIVLLSVIACLIVFPSEKTLSFFLLLMLSVVLSLSTKRRLRDAKQNKIGQWIPGSLLLLMSLLSLFIESNGRYILLILPLLSILFFLRYPSKNKKYNSAYILGYYGPVDLNRYVDDSKHNKIQKQRIEPTLAATSTSESSYINESINEGINKKNNHSDYPFDDEINNETEYNTTNKHAEISEIIRLTLLNHRKLTLSFLTITALILIIFLVNITLNVINQTNNSLSNKTDNNELSAQQKLQNNSQATIITQRDHLLAMPDNFNLYLSEYKGIIIHWQADQLADSLLWSLSSAQGDKSCQRITFNKGSHIRALAVLVENGSEYFASFSPLDSKELIQALAFRSNFSLCGYRFSLKGTQAVLSKHNQYTSFLNTGS